MERHTVQVNGQEVRRLRIIRGWSQDELSRRAGIAKRTVESLERNKRPAHLFTVRSIAGALNTEIADLLGDPTVISKRVSARGLYVFISYSHRDSELADGIATDLTNLNIKYFLDRKDIRWGQSIRQNVRDALEQCSHQIIILSPASIKSPWVHFEAGYAMGSGRVALPFLSHPSLEMPGYFGDLLFKYQREDIAEYFRSLIR